MGKILATCMPRGGAWPAALAELCEDADGVGTPLHEVLRQAGRRAFLEGVAYLLVDWEGPHDPGCAADESGARYVVRVVPADDVLALVCSLDGSAQEAIIRLPAADGSVILWRVDAGTAQRALLGTDGRSIAFSGAQEDHRHDGEAG